MKLKKISLLVLMLGLASAGTFAQDAEPTEAAEKKSPFPSVKEFNRWSIGINAGMLIGHTDLSPIDPNGADKNFGYGLVITRMFSHTIGMQGQILKGGLSDTRPENDSYQTNFFEHTLNLVFNMGSISFLKSEPKLSFQGFIGMGLNHFTSDYYRSDGSKSDHYDSPKAMEIAYPAGIVMKYKLPKSLTLELGYSIRGVNTDILDRYSFRTGGKDKYSYWNFGLSANIGKKEKDIDWENPLNTLYEDMAVMRDKMAGLGGDKDNDGVADLYDKDNETAEGVPVDGSGRALDVDGDGIADFKDSDPFTDKGAVVDANGKAVDTDGDGVPDQRDLDNNTKPGELVNFQGRGIMVGGGAPSTPSVDGKPAPVAYSGGGGVGQLPPVFFALGSSNIEYAYYENLAEVANALKSNTGMKLKIVGHTDATGSESFNQTLGTSRAQSCIDHLVKIYGIDAARLSADSKGESDPLATKGQNKMNRRVDFWATK